MSAFLPFAELNDALAATTKKLQKRALIANYLRSLPVEDAGRAALWLSGTPFPETDARDLNVGGSLLSKAVAELSAAPEHALGAAYRRHGDLGAAAADLLQAKKPGQANKPGQADKPGGDTATGTLMLAAVESSLAALSAARGPQPKLRLLLDLLARATPVEAKYLIKLITGDMRTGVKQSLVEEAIADAWPPPGNQSSTKTSPKAVSASQAVRRASMLLGSLPEVVALAAAGRLDQARMKLFHPLGFMLASPVQSVDEAIARVTEETKAERSGSSEALPAASPGLPAAHGIGWQLEDKYDGIRAQLHIGNRAGFHSVALYSRNREDLSASFPELVEAFAAIGEPAILDGEILAWNPATGRALSFSTLQQRLGRKRVTQEMLRDIPVVLVVFDILYRGTELLLDKPLVHRRSALEDFASRWSPTAAAAAEPRGQGHLFAAAEQARAEKAFSRLILAPATRFQSARRSTAPDESTEPDLAAVAAMQQLDQAYTDARARGNEGVMIKSVASLYQPGRRGLAWLKLKRELATLDVVVTGVEYGNGRRAHVLSDYTFAVRDPNDPAEPLKNVGKAYSGLTDQEIAEMTAFFKGHTLEDTGHFRTVEPVVILEVAFNNVMRSARHASGFALRFPRILRIRNDKPVDEIDTLARVEEIYNSQPDKPVDPESADGS